MGKINLENKKILVVGGNGYLGSFLVSTLKERNLEVYTFSRNCAETSTDFKVNIANYEQVENAIQKIKPDVVYHLAANISRDRDFSIYEDMDSVNVKGTYNLLKSLKEIDCHFIFTSSSEIYGNNTSPFHEKQVPKPVSPYSLTKINAEFVIETFSKNYNKKYTNLRVFNFFGEYMPEDFFIPQMIKSLKKEEDFLMTKGEQVRDFLYVKDVVNALILSAENNNSYGETLNVCSGRGTKLSELAESVNSTMNTKSKVIIGALPYRNNEVWEMIGDNSKIKNKIGFEPTYTIDEGIKILINHS